MVCKIILHLKNINRLLWTLANLRTCMYSKSPKGYLINAPNYYCGIHESNTNHTCVNIMLLLWYYKPQKLFLIPFFLGGGGGDRPPESGSGMPPLMRLLTDVAPDPQHCRFLVKWLLCKKNIGILQYI